MDCNHCSSEVASVEVAFFRHHRGDTSVEAPQRVCADHDAEAEGPQVRSVHENLYVIRRALLRDVRGCPCVVRAVGENMLGPLCHSVQWRRVPLRSTDQRNLRRNCKYRIETMNAARERARQWSVLSPNIVIADYLHTHVFSWSMRVETTFMVTFVASLTAAFHLATSRTAAVNAHILP